MIAHCLNISCIISMLCTVLLLSACRSPDTTYYVLYSGITTPQVEKAQGPRVQMRRVDIPGYLDRNAIVTRSQEGVRLQLAEYNAWAEPLSSGMQRIMSEVMTPLLLEKNVLLQALDDDSRGALQLFVQVQRFDGILGGDTVLDARWTLRTTDDATMARGSYMDKEPAGTTYESLVQAQSTLLQRMATAISPPVAQASLAKAR